jgi:hypothetical protein
MKFSIKFNGRNLAVEAESLVNVIIKIIDICSVNADNMGFHITESCENCYLSVCQT